MQLSQLRQWEMWAPTCWKSRSSRHWAWRRALRSPRAPPVFPLVILMLNWEERRQRQRAATRRRGATPRRTRGAVSRTCTRACSAIALAAARWSCAGIRGAGIAARPPATALVGSGLSRATWRTCPSTGAQCSSTVSSCAARTRRFSPDARRQPTGRSYALETILLWDAAAICLRLIIGWERASLLFHLRWRCAFCCTSICRRLSDGTEAIRGANLEVVPKILRCSRSSKPSRGCLIAAVRCDAMLMLVSRCEGEGDGGCEGGYSARANISSQLMHFCVAVRRRSGVREERRAQSLEPSRARSPAAPACR